MRPRVFAYYGTILLHGDDDCELSISASFLEVVELYNHKDSCVLFLQIVYALLRDVTNDTGDFLLLSIDFFLEIYGCVGIIRYRVALDPLT